MFKVRSDEPQYAFLWDKETKTKNCYGKKIELTDEKNTLRNQSLNINNDNSIGENPNRYKQHGFYFNADNCIGCHACESACSEKNDVPGHLAFRSVGFVEGGSYPDYQRINISMACNHCDDPVCLKGCPTRAYTKFAEYGAVLQDPEICFGCGYCTWVCPYNAPQLDPVKGEVSKCNMCVDRLEVGLKPACVSACLGNALDFGVVENIPENRQEAKTAIPGFPTTDITHPNIRFQQQRGAHLEMIRTDSMPIKYQRETKSGAFHTVVDEKAGTEKHWNLRKLLTSHESSHAIFTLSTQATLGAFLLLIFSDWLDIEAFSSLHIGAVKITLLLLMLVVCTYGLFKLNMHLGKPHRFYRGFNNLQWSPVSREIAGVSLFYTGLLGYCVGSFVDWSLFNFIASASAVLAVIGGPVGLYYMYKLYRIKARPFWDHWQTASSFVGSMISLGGLLAAIPLLIFEPIGIAESQSIIKILALIIFSGLMLEAVGLLAHARDMKARGNEGAASFYEQTTEYGKSYIFRNVLLSVSIILAALIGLFGISSGFGIAMAMFLASSMLVMAAFGRLLFYVLVIPTTMPGAFFWKNKGFVEHAREIGLAERPQVGIVYERHHPFKFDELIKTIKANSFHDMLAHVKMILNFK